MKHEEETEPLGRRIGQPDPFTVAAGPRIAGNRPAMKGEAVDLAKEPFDPAEYRSDAYGAAASET